MSEIKESLFFWLFAAAVAAIFFTLFYSGLLAWPRQDTDWHLVLLTLIFMALLRIRTALEEIARKLK